MRAPKTTAKKNRNTNTLTREWIVNLANLEQKTTMGSKLNWNDCHFRSPLQNRTLWQLRTAIVVRLASRKRGKIRKHKHTTRQQEGKKMGINHKNDMIQLPWRRKWCSHLAIPMAYFTLFLWVEFWQIAPFFFSVVCAELIETNEKKNSNN